MNKSVSLVTAEFEPLWGNNFTINFKSESLSSREIKILEISVSNVDFPKLPITSDAEFHCGNFSIGFTNFQKGDLLPVIKKMALAEDLVITVNILTPSGKNIYKPITLSGCIFNLFKVNNLNCANQEPVEIKVYFTSLVSNDFLVRDKGDGNEC